MNRDKIIERDGKTFLQLATDAAGFIQIKTQIEIEQDELSGSHRQTEARSRRVSDPIFRGPELGPLLRQYAELDTLKSAEPAVSSGADFKQTESKTSEEKPKTPKELGLILLRQAKERRLASRP
jgi:hypothetical protein